MRGNKTLTNLSEALVLDDREKHVPTQSSRLLPFL